MLKHESSTAIRVGAVLASLVVVLPLAALLLQVPWSSLFARLTSETAASAIRLTSWTSCVSAGLALLLGTPLAWWLARSRSRAVLAIRPVILTPIVLPPTVAGIALLALMGRAGLLGRYLYQATGWSMPFTRSAVVAAGLFVALPFFVLILESSFRGLPPEMEDAARTDGASEWQVFWLIGLPQSRNAVATGLLLAWARALGEFGATMMFAGATPGTTMTWPMAVYSALEVDMNDALALSVVMVAIAVGVVFALRRQLTTAFAR